jgi:hypothetical protein
MKPSRSRKQVPTLNDPDIQKLLKKYPVTSSKSKNSQVSKKEDIKRLTDEVEYILEHETAIFDINVQDLKQLIERIRLDQSILTSDML